MSKIPWNISQKEMHSFWTSIRKCSVFHVAGRRSNVPQGGWWIVGYILTMLGVEHGTGLPGFLWKAHTFRYIRKAIRKSCPKAEKESGAGIPLKSGWIFRWKTSPRMYWLFSNNGKAISSRCLIREPSVEADSSCDLYGCLRRDEFRTVVWGLSDTLFCWSLEIVMPEGWNKRCKPVMEAIGKGPTNLRTWIEWICRMPFFFGGEIHIPRKDWGMIIYCNQFFLVKLSALKPI